MPWLARVCNRLCRHVLHLQDVACQKGYKEQLIAAKAKLRAKRLVGPKNNTALCKILCLNVGESFTWRLTSYKGEIQIVRWGSTALHFHMLAPPFTILLCIGASMHRGHAQLTSTLGEPIDKLNRPGPCSPTLGYATKEKRLYNYSEKYLFYMYPRMYTCTLELWQCH